MKKHKKYNSLHFYFHFFNVKKMLKKIAKNQSLTDLCINNVHLKYKRFIEVIKAECRCNVSVYFMS